MEAAHQEEETTRLFWTGVEGCLSWTLSEGRDNFCSGLVFVSTQSLQKYMFFLDSGINHCNTKREYIH
jgi:hypothetical protein